MYSVVMLRPLASNVDRTDGGVSSFVARIAVELSDEGGSRAAVLLRDRVSGHHIWRVMSGVDFYLVVALDTLVRTEAVEGHGPEI